MDCVSPSEKNLKTVRVRDLFPFDKTMHNKNFGILVTPTSQHFGWPSLYLVENRIAIVVRQFTMLPTPVMPLNDENPIRNSQEYIGHRELIFRI